MRLTFRPLLRYTQVFAELKESSSTVRLARTPHSTSIVGRRGMAEHFQVAGSGIQHFWKALRGVRPCTTPVSPNFCFARFRRAYNFNEPARPLGSKRTLVPLPLPQIGHICSSLFVSKRGLPVRVTRRKTTTTICENNKRRRHRKIRCVRPLGSNTPPPFLHNNSCTDTVLTTKLIINQLDEKTATSAQGDSLNLTVPTTINRGGRTPGRDDRTSNFTAGIKKGTTLRYAEKSDHTQGDCLQRMTDRSQQCQCVQFQQDEEDLLELLSTDEHKNKNGPSGTDLLRYWAVDAPQAPLKKKKKKKHGHLLNDINARWKAAHETPDPSSKELDRHTADPRALHFDAPPARLTHHPVRPPGPRPIPPPLDIEYSRQSGRFDMSHHRDDYEQFRVARKSGTGLVATILWWELSSKGNCLKGYVFNKLGTPDGKRVSLSIGKSTTRETLREGLVISMDGGNIACRLGIPRPPMPSHGYKWIKAEEDSQRYAMIEQGTSRQFAKYTALAEDDPHSPFSNILHFCKDLHIHLTEVNKLHASGASNTQSPIHVDLQKAIIALHSVYHKYDTEKAWHAQFGQNKENFRKEITNQRAWIEQCKEIAELRIRNWSLRVESERKKREYDEKVKRRNKQLEDLEHMNDMLKSDPHAAVTEMYRSMGMSKEDLDDALRKMDEATESKQYENSAAIVIQSALRQFRTRVVYQRSLHAAVSIQSAVRCYLTRGKHRLRLRAIVLMQARARGYNSRSLHEVTLMHHYRPPPTVSFQFSVRHYRTRDSEDAPDNLEPIVPSSRLEIDWPSDRSEALQDIVSIRPRNNCKTSRDESTLLLPKVVRHISNIQANIESTLTHDLEDYFDEREMPESSRCLKTDRTSNKYAPLACLSCSPKDPFNESRGNPRCENKGDPLQIFIFTPPQDNCMTSNSSDETLSHPPTDATILNDGWTTVQSKQQKRQQRQALKATVCPASTEKAQHYCTKQSPFDRQKLSNKPVSPVNQKNSISFNMVRPAGRSCAAFLLIARCAVCLDSCWRHCSRNRAVRC